MPRVLGGFYGGGHFLMGTVPLQERRNGTDLPFEDHDPRARVQPCGNLECEKLFYTINLCDHTEN